MSKSPLCAPVVARVLRKRPTAPAPRQPDMSYACETDNDGAYLTSNPTMRPATFMRTSHDQKVALSSGRTLSYHTPLPTVDNAMVDSQRSVANSIPASGPPPCTHRPPLRR